MSHARTCIKCSESMTRKEVEGVEVDACAHCGGLWLDKGELHALSKGFTGSVEALEALEAAPSASETVNDGPYREYQVLEPKYASPLDAPCPACRGKLALACIGVVQVENCTECDGIYLDRGEIEKVMKVMSKSGSAVTTIAALARSVSTRGTIDS